MHGRIFLRLEPKNIRRGTYSITSGTEKYRSGDVYFYVRSLKISSGDVIDSTPDVNGSLMDVFVSTPDVIHSSPSLFIQSFRVNEWADARGALSYALSFCAISPTLSLRLSIYSTTHTIHYRALIICPYKWRGCSAFSLLSSISTFARVFGDAPGSPACGMKRESGRNFGE